MVEARGIQRHRLRVPLFVNIFTLFLVVVVATLGVFTAVTASLIAESSRQNALFILNQSAARIVERTQSVNRTLAQATNTLSHMSDVSTPPGLNGHAAQVTFLQTIAQSELITSIHLAFDDGRSFEVRRFLPGYGDRARAILNAPVAARYGIHVTLPNTDGEMLVLRRFFDDRRRLVGHAIEAQRVDPRTLPWYDAAFGSGVFSTLPYEFPRTREIGISLARPFRGTTSGVLAVNMTLDAMTAFFRAQRQTDEDVVLVLEENGTLLVASEELAAIFSGEGERTVQMIVHPAREALATWVNREIVGRGGEGGEPRFAPIDVNGNEYYAVAYPFTDITGVNRWAVISAPARLFQGALEGLVRRSVLLAVVIVVVAVPFILLVSRQISRPLSAVSAEAHRIAQLDLNSPFFLRSRILEVDRLAHDVRTMKQALSSFAVYSPRQLVRELIDEGVPPVLGGRKRPIAVLFTDIRAFSMISETAEPEGLVSSLSEYFSLASKILETYDGVISKFIGDALMAMWNMPRACDDFVFNACRASLVCRHELNQLARAWEDEGRTPFYTRFGLHAGEALIGNVGAPDRMDYTAIGNTVNIAARMEAMNKEFGTQMLVSQQVMDAVYGRIVGRKVAAVVPKGVATPLAVHQLFGVHPNAAAQARSGDVVADIDDVRFCEDWATGVAYYESRRWDKAEEVFRALSAERSKDPISKRYAELAGYFRRNPPGAEWNGVETSKVK